MCFAAYEAKDAIEKKIDRTALVYLFHNGSLAFFFMCIGKG